MKAVVDMNGDWKGGIRFYFGDEKSLACIFVDKFGYHAIDLPWDIVSKCHGIFGGLQTPICTISEFEEAASKWKEQQTVEAPKLQSLLNTKLDCRKPDGTVDEELSRAFQEAVTEGMHNKYCGYALDTYSGSVEKFTSATFLFVSLGGMLSYDDSGEEDFFNRNSKTQINFKYSRTLTWEATEVKPVVEDELVSICGVEYSAKELKEALDLISKVKK